jgi:hypothetical protein
MDVSGQLHDLAALHTGKHPSTHSIGDWVGPIFSMDFLEKGDMSCLHGIGTPEHPAHSPVTTLAMLAQILFVNQCY